MKQTGLFRSITEVQANCKQSGKTGAVEAHRKTMWTVTYILLGSGGRLDSRPLGAPAQQRGGCKQLSFQVPGPGPASVLSAIRAVCAELAKHIRTFMETSAKWCSGIVPVWCLAPWKAARHLLWGENLEKNSSLLSTENSLAVKIVSLYALSYVARGRTSEGQSCLFRHML